MDPLRFLVLSGPTREYLDPVRYLSNASSGRQGIAIVRAALARGHEVDLVQGPVSVAAPPQARVHPVVSALDMLDAARRLHPSCDVLIAAAAVSDFRPRRRAEAKIKRAHDPAAFHALELVENPDILVELAPRKGRRIHIGFALESTDLEANARRKIDSKGLDWIVANTPSAFGAPAGRYLLLGADGSRRDLGELSKDELAALVVDLALSAGAGSRRD
jgi:phosphopantothenoylcysteine decarboxylase/phosphopantothenate--cysteine ligase